MRLIKIDHCVASALDSVKCDTSGVFAQATAPNSAPTPAVTAIANAPQKVTRRAPTITPAPPEPIGDDPEALRSLTPGLDIWDAYETIHVVMPDGSMKLGGDAVAEVLRNLPNTKWFAWAFATRIFGFQPFQAMLNVAYAILSDVRPIFGCESCGKPKWLRPLEWISKKAKVLFGGSPPLRPTPHFSKLSAAPPRAVAISASQPNSV